MREWKLVVPAATTNRALNPSAETTGNFAALGGATATRVTTHAKYGLYSYRVQTAADNDGLSLTLQALANAVHFVTLLARGTLPAGWDWSLDNATYSEPEALLAIDAEWTLYGLVFPAAQANGATALYVRQNGAGAGDFYVDGAQVEEHAFWTTFCDGTQAGCQWNGAAHGSSSTRSAASRAGGRVVDLEDYALEIVEQMGMGAATLKQQVDEYALLPGGALNAVKARPRAFALAAQIVNRGGDNEDLHAYRQALVEELAHDRYPREAAGWQAARLWYAGAEVVKEIGAHYGGGLEAVFRAENWFAHYERFVLDFVAPDPYWREIGESAAALDEVDTATLRYVAGRMRGTGQWSALGLTANPTGGAGVILAIAYNPVDGRYYVGGMFTGLNGVAGRDYVAVYDPATGTWATLGAGSAVSSNVRAIAVAPNGDVYVGGDFANLGGANGDYVAYWDLSAGAWTPVAAGGTGNVYSLKFGLDGTLYIGGNFLNWAAIAAADYVVKWTGAAYAAVAAAILNGQVLAMATHPNGDVYLGGAMTQIDAATCNYWCRFDGTTFQVIDTALNSTVEALAIDAAGTVYLGGVFTTPTSRIARWNGQQLEALGDGVNSIVWALEVGPDGMLYAGGAFTTAGDLTLADCVAKWNGSSWSHLDADLPGAPTVVYSLEVGPADPVLEHRFDLLVGFDTTGASYFAGSATVTNEGTAPAFPRIAVTRSGGTSARLASIRNETTGLELLFDYALLDGETLTIDLTPTAKSIRSNFFGLRMDAVLANCDFGQFCLQPGANQVTCFVIEAGAPTVTAALVWRDTFRSCD